MFFKPRFLQPPSGGSSAPAPAPSGFGYRFAAERPTASGTQTVLAGATNKLLFGAILEDSASAYSTANSRWVAPATCTMRISGRILIQGSGFANGCILSIRKNNVEFARGPQATGTTSMNNGHVSESVPMVAGDYVELFLTAGATNLIVNQAFVLSGFSGFQIG